MKSLSLIITIAYLLMSSILITVVVVVVVNNNAKLIEWPSGSI